MKFCSEFNEVLTFFPDIIRSCCVLGNIGPVYLDIKTQDIKNFDVEHLKSYKLQVTNQLENEDFTGLPCQNCFHLKDKTDELKFSPKYSLIYLNNWTHCNCGCFYCDRLQYSKGKITNKKEKSEYYDVLPIIKALYKYDLLDKERLRVVFHGGDFSVLKEFEPLVKTFIKNGVNKIDFSSNNIIFQPLVAKMLQQQKASLNMSLDCGSKDTYKLIKRVDKFNDVIKNLEKYVKCSHSDNPEINVKYIILKNVNDNEQEIVKFINLMKKIGITRVSLHLEHKYAIELFQNKNNIPANYKHLITFFFDLCRDNNFYFDKPDEIMHYIMTNQ